MKDRNELSLLLNKEKEKLGQLECNIGTVAGSGGWCKEDSSVNSTEHMTDNKLAKLCFPKTLLILEFIIVDSLDLATLSSPTEI